MGNKPPAPPQSQVVDITYAYDERALMAILQGNLCEARKYIKIRPHLVRRCAVEAARLGYQIVVAQILAEASSINRELAVSALINLSLNGRMVLYRDELTRFLFREYGGNYAPLVQAAALGRLDQVRARFPLAEAEERDEALRAAKAAEQCAVVIYFYRAGMEASSYLPESVVGQQRYWWELRRLKDQTGSLDHPSMQRHLAKYPQHWGLNAVLPHNLVRYVEEAL